MMMTCRLLCALLVLALCCCPSECGTGSDDDKPTVLSSSSPELKEQGNPVLGQDPVKGPGAVLGSGKRSEDGSGEASGGHSNTHDGAGMPGQSGPVGENTDPPGSTDKSHESLVNNLEQATDESKN
ncbi:mucin TcMUCII [Trypanosoma cruzi]|nr:mucin TcMUCII [Trypanosoma cruzi]